MEVARTLLSKVGEALNAAVSPDAKHIHKYGPAVLAGLATPKLAWDAWLLYTVKCGAAPVELDEDDEPTAVKIEKACSKALSVLLEAWESCSEYCDLANLGPAVEEVKVRLGCDTRFVSVSVLS